MDRYLFVESLERFLLDAEKATRAWLLDPDRDAMLHPAATAFGPETIAVRSAAYERAIDGQPAFAHESIAKHIIALVSDGERDPRKLCQRALALTERELRSPL